jgi:hypothetical protein
MACFSWAWLVPPRLLDEGLPVAWCGLAVALAWLPGVLARQRGPHRWLGPAASLLAALPVLALALDLLAWQFLACLAAYGVLAGLGQRSAGGPQWLLSRATSTPRNEESPGSEGPDGRPGPDQLGPQWVHEAEQSGPALGLVLGPLVGVMLLALAGQQAVFVGGAAMTLAAALTPIGNRWATR